MVMTSDARVLLVGLDPGAVDYANLSPGIDLDEATLAARIAEAHAEVRAAGFNLVVCLVDTIVERAESQVHEQLAHGPFDLALIGAGIRLLPDNTLLFERVMNVINEAAPGIKFCFNTHTPEDTINVMRRWVQPPLTLET